jgi:hypothetical protein
VADLDLGPVLDRATTLLGQALQTVGTVVDLVRPGPGATVDPETTATVPGAETVLATGVPALVVPDAPGGLERIYPGAREGQEPRIRVLLPPEYVDLRRGDEIRVTESRDERLVGARLTISVMVDNSAGVGRTVLALRVPIGGQT